MFENRSFDQMLGFLYADANNHSAAGHEYEGLTREESNPDDTGREIKVYKIEANGAHPYLMPGADPGEGFYNTNLCASARRGEGALGHRGQDRRELEARRRDRSAGQNAIRAARNR